MGERGIHSHSKHILSVWLVTNTKQAYLWMFPSFRRVQHCPPPMNSFIRKTCAGSYLLPLGGKQIKRPR